MHSQGIPEVTQRSIFFIKVITGYKLLFVWNTPYAHIKTWNIPRDSSTTVLEFIIKSTNKFLNMFSSIFQILFESSCKSTQLSTIMIIMCPDI